MSEETIPNPGSQAAQDMGCRCPVLDNNHGRFTPWPGAWWINSECSIHAEWSPPES